MDDMGKRDNSDVLVVKSIDNGRVEWVTKLSIIELNWVLDIIKRAILAPKRHDGGKIITSGGISNFIRRMRK